MLPPSKYVLLCVTVLPLKEKFRKLLGFFDVDSFVDGMSSHLDRHCMASVELLM